MGCSNSRLDTINKLKKRRTSLSQSVKKNKVKYMTSINGNQSKDNNATNINSIEVNNTSIKENSIQNFTILEKIEDNFEFKSFRCLNKKTNQFQLMYVIYKNEMFDKNLLEKYKKFNYSSLINLCNNFEDENFDYIITDFIKHNIFDIGICIHDFHLEKLKVLIYSFIECLIYLQNNNNNIIPISSFDHSNFKISSKGFFYLDYIDIYNIILNEEIKFKSIEEILYTLCKILIILFNENEMFQFDIYSYDNCTKDDLIQIIYNNNFEEDKRFFFDALLNYNSENDTLKSLLLHSFLKININDSKIIIGKNPLFDKFTTEYYFFNSTLKFIQFKKYYKENSEYFKNLFYSFEGLKDNKISIQGISANFWSKLRKRYTEYELLELVSDTLEYDFDYLDYTNFIRCLSNFDSKVCKMKLKGDFMIYTRENNYKINITDLQKIYGIEINNEIKEILSEFNINKDNSLTFNEFLYIIYKIF